MRSRLQEESYNKRECLLTMQTFPFLNPSCNF
jgi:hypothetical protein